MKYKFALTWWWRPSLWAWSLPLEIGSYKTIEAGPLQLEWWPASAENQLKTLEEGRGLDLIDKRCECLICQGQVPTWNERRGGEGDE